MNIDRTNATVIEEKRQISTIDVDTRQMPVDVKLQDDVRLERIQFKEEQRQQVIVGEYQPKTDTDVRKMSLFQYLNLREICLSPNFLKVRFQMARFSNGWPLAINVMVLMVRMGPLAYLISVHRVEGG